ncbi:MAG: ABC transporter substrate-binding protein [Xanthomonadales bacterium]|nr:ABC transporter substrate-binding protein [Xanthomonadales bacterium]
MCGSSLDGPHARLPLVLSGQPGMMISPDALDDPALDQNPVGAGMMTVTEYEPGTQITYEAYDDYWEPEAVKVAGMEGRLINDFSARLNALREGTLDAARLEPGQAEEAASAGLEVLEQESIEIGQLQLNRAKEPLDDVDVRRALNHAIDREGIVNGVMFGYGVPAVQIYPEGLYAHDPDTPVDTYEYDPEKAQQMLADAGYPDGFDMEINVAALDFVVSYAEAIQAQLGEVGVNVTINQVELSQYGDVVYVQANGEGTAVIGAARTDPTQTALQFQPDAFTNPGGASSPEVEQLYQESLDSTLSIEERADILQELSATLTEQAFSVVIFHPINPWGVSSDVVGLQPYRDVFEFRGVGIKKS